MAHKVVNVPVVQGHKEIGIVVFGAKLGGSVLRAVVPGSLKFRNGAPVSGLTNMPATNTAGTYEDTSVRWASSSASRKMTSAMGERQMFPVQTKTM